MKGRAVKIAESWSGKSGRPAQRMRPQVKNFCFMRKWMKKKPQYIEINLVFPVNIEAGEIPQNDNPNPLKPGTKDQTEMERPPQMLRN